MSYQIVGRDECGDEQVMETGFVSENAAQSQVARVREEYPEFGALWTELQKDKAYYQQQAQSRYDNDEGDLY